MTDIAERRTVISGIGKSAVGRRLGRDSLDLTVDACLSAIGDAGLDAHDIDGISTYPGGPHQMSTADVQDALSLRVNWHCGSADGPAQLGALVNACAAVAMGWCRHVLVFHTVASHAPAASTPPRAQGDMSWLLPFDALSPANWHALGAQWHFSHYGTTREQLAWIPITQRSHAAVNPNAIYRDPITLDDYLSARMISTPLCLLDCDVPVDGSTAFVVSAVEHAHNVDHACARIHAIGTSRRERPLWDQWSDCADGTREAAAMMWSRAEVKPGDVDVALLYDGFSSMTLNWLEQMGFCAPGEGGPFVEGGTRISLGGQLPLNTDGGQLSAGRLHGFGHIYEAAQQLRGACGERQVDAAEVAVVSNGGGHIAGCMVLTKEGGDGAHASSPRHSS